VLRVDDSVSLFESSAINEYLDETIAPRLHPEDPVQRAINRAWTDYVPTFAEHVTHRSGRENSNMRISIEGCRAAPQTKSRDDRHQQI
jgi:glutathione S-transferase